MRRIDYIVLHHSGGTPTASETDTTGELRFEVIKKDQHDNAIQEHWGENYVMDYHYVIGPTGIVFKGMPMEQVAFHCANYQINLISLGICFLGNFEIAKPTTEQLKAGIDKVKELMNYFGVALDHVKKHSDFVATDCPGKNFPFEQFIQELKEPMEFDKAIDEAIRLNLIKPPVGIDMKKYREENISLERMIVILIRLYHLLKGGY